MYGIYIVIVTCRRKTYWVASPFCVYLRRRPLLGRRCGTPSDEGFSSAFQKRSLYRLLSEDHAKVTVASGTGQNFRRQSVLDGLFSFCLSTHWVGDMHGLNGDDDILACGLRLICFFCVIAVRFYGVVFGR